MNIEQANTELSSLGIVDFCNISGGNDQNFIIAITEFTYSNEAVMSIMAILQNHINDVYPVVDHLSYDIAAKTAKIQLSKVQ